jgi:hypothetical protein
MSFGPEKYQTFGGQEKNLYTCFLKLQLTHQIDNCERIFFQLLLNMVEEICKMSAKFVDITIEY